MISNKDTKSVHPGGQHTPTITVPSKINETNRQNIAPTKLTSRAIRSYKRIMEIQEEGVEAERAWNESDQPWRKAKASDEEGSPAKAVLLEYSHPKERTGNLNALVYRVRVKKKLLDLPCESAKIHSESRPERWIGLGNEVLADETMLAAKAASINQLLLHLKTPKTVQPNQSNCFQQTSKRQLVGSNSSNSTLKKVSFDRPSPLHQAAKQRLDGLGASSSAHQDKDKRTVPSPSVRFRSTTSSLAEPLHDPPNSEEDQYGNPRYNQENQPTLSRAQQKAKNISYYRKMGYAYREVDNTGNTIKHIEARGDPFDFQTRNSQEAGFEGGPIVSSPRSRRNYAAESSFGPCKQTSVLTQETELDLPSPPPISHLQKNTQYQQADLDEDAFNREASDEEFFEGTGAAFEEEFFDNHGPALEDDSWPLLQSPLREPHADRNGMSDEAEATPTAQSPSGGRTSQRTSGSRADIAIQSPSRDHPDPEEEVTPLSEGKSRRLPPTEVSAPAMRRAQLPRKSAPIPGPLKKKARRGKGRLPANQVVVYPFVAWNPDQKLWADVSSISDWNTLHGIFENQYKKITRKKKYGTMTRNPATYLESVQGSCIGVYIVQHSGGSTYKKSEGEERRACDSCIKAHRPCIILFETSEGVVKMGMCPLPDALRGDAMWDQSAFWVHGLTENQDTE